MSVKNKKEDSKEGSDNEDDEKKPLNKDDANKSEQKEMKMVPNAE